MSPEESGRCRMLHDLVAECVSRHPDEVCLVFDSGDGEADNQQRITYFQLWQTAMELKSAFDSLSMKQQIVGVLLGDDIRVPSVLLGLLSSSCAFHPFNTEGLHYACNALRTAGASWILAHSQLSQQLKPLLRQLEGVEVSSADLSKIGLKLFRILPNSAPPLTLVQEFNIAYSITTSGTTSAPKVVLVPHACILPNIIDLQNIFQLSIGDRVLLTSPLTFDPSIIDIFCTLSSGACLVIIPSEVKRRPDKLLDMIHCRQAITVMQATPTLIRSFCPSKLQKTLLGPATALRVLALGGEQFPARESLMAWLHADNMRTQFYNLYGVTEVSCWASCQHVDVTAVIKQEELISIGETLSKTVIKLVADETVTETPTSDCEGDIWIGSQSRVCLIDAEVSENSEKSWSSEVKERGQIVWRNTGDRGKLLQDGRILCLGRRDDQVKRHGKRLSLEALEMVCKEVTGILDCTALMDKANLMLFIVPDSDCNLTEHPDTIRAASGTDDRPADQHSVDDRPAGRQSVDDRPVDARPAGQQPVDARPASRQPVDESDFRVTSHDTDWPLLQQRLSAHIEASLPKHYIPTTVVKIAAGYFPLTQNGKLDKKQLLKIGYEEVNAGMEVKNVWNVSQQVWKVPSASSTHTNNSHVSQHSPGDNMAGGKAVNEREQNINSLRVYNKKLQPEKHKHKSSDEWTGNKMAKRTHIFTSSEAAAMSASLPSSVELRGDCKLLLQTHSNAPSKRQEKLECHNGNLGTGCDANKGHDVSEVSLQTSHSASSKSQVKLGSGKDHLGLSCDVDAEKDQGLILPLETCRRHSSAYQEGMQSRQEYKELSIATDCSAYEHTDHELPSDTYLRSSSGHQGSLENRQDSQELDPATDVTTDRHIFSHSPIKVMCRGLTRQKGNELLRVDQSKISNVETNTCKDRGSYDDAIEANTAGGHNSTKTLKAVLGVTLKWKFDTKKCVDASPLVVQQGGLILAFIGSHSGQFSAINILTGSCLWSVTLPDRIESSACCSLCGSYVIVGCYDGIVYVMDATSGLIVWRFPTGDTVKCSPVVDDHTGYVMCGSHDGFLYCLDIHEKRCVWKCYLGGGSVFSSPVIDSSTRLVYAASLSGKVLGIWADSGTVKWRCELQKPVFSSLCLLGHFVLVGCVDGKLYCLDSLGQIEWIFSTQSSIFSTPVVYKSSIILGSHNHHIYCLTNSGQQLWTFQASSPVYAAAFASTLNIPKDNDQHPCTDFPLGRSTVKEPLNHALTQPCSVVVAAETKGVLYVLDHKDGQVQADVRLPGEIFSSPAVVDNLIVFGCRDNFVYCFEIVSSQRK
ncbi:hypothetical protein BsWGS_18046 [Bradybaena similaris]